MVKTKNIRYKTNNQRDEIINSFEKKGLEFIHGLIIDSKDEIFEQITFKVKS